MESRIPAANIQTARFPDKTTNPFYASSAWIKLVASLIKERGRVCEDPNHNYNRTHKRKNALPDPNNLGRIYGDHIVEIADGGEPLSKSNVRLLCSVCHGRKTAAVAIQRRNTKYKVEGKEQQTTRNKPSTTNLNPILA